MPNTTITGLPAAGSADPNAVVAADNSSGTLTEKVTLQQIADLASSNVPSGNYNGDVLTWDGTANVWTAAQPSGGNPFDQSLNTTDAVAFNSVTLPNASSLSQGSWDSGMGGAQGISLFCTGGYELNWQAGHLMCTADGGVTASPILCDSPIEFPGAGVANMQIDNAGITFPDGTTQTTAGGGGGGIPAPSSPNGGDLLSYDSAAMAWIATAPQWGIPSPTSINNGDVLTYSVNASAWIASAPTGIPAPSSPSNGDILSWNGSAWVAVMATTPGLPSGSQGQYLKFDGTNWVAAAVFPSVNGGQYLQWDGTQWVGAAMSIADYSPSTGYETGDLVAYNNTIWRATSTGMGNQPQYGSTYWANLSIIDNNPIPSPSTPSQGDVLTYSAATSSWVAAAPAGGATYLSGVVTTDIFADGLLEQVLTLAPIVGNSTYLVEGLVVFSTMYNQQMRLYLGAYDEDGQVFLDHDKATADLANARTTVRRVDQMASETVEFESSGDQVVDVPIRFRALIQTANISSTSLVLRCGDSVDGQPCDILAGSWMVATKIA